MEEGSHVWLRSPKSEWGWLPAVIIKKERVPFHPSKKGKLHISEKELLGDSETPKSENGDWPPKPVNRKDDDWPPKPVNRKDEDWPPKPVNRKDEDWPPKPVNRKDEDWPPKPVNRSSSSVSTSSIDEEQKKAIDKLRREELQAVMRNRSLSKEERHKRMEEIKAKYTNMTPEKLAQATSPPKKEAPPKKETPPPPKEPAPTTAAPPSSSIKDEKKSETENEGESVIEGNIIELTLKDDFAGLGKEGEYFLKSSSNNKDGVKNIVTKSSGYGRGVSGYYAKMESFTQVITVDWDELRAHGGEHPDIKLRNMPASSSSATLSKSPVGSRRNLTVDTGSHDPNGVAGQPSTLIKDNVAGGVDDLIGLTHLHEPAILHALRLRYNADIIYTSTGPILLAINPFKAMDVYGKALMDMYRIQGEMRHHSAGQNVASNPGTPRSGPTSPVKGNNSNVPSLGSLFPTNPQTDYGKPIPKVYLQRPDGKLPPHAYQTADDAYRAMMRGMEMEKFVKRSSRRGGRRGEQKNDSSDDLEMPTNQSILVSGESGAGKTVTTKIVLNYFAMLSKKLQEQMAQEVPEAPNSADGLLSPKSLTGRQSSKKSVSASGGKSKTKVTEQDKSIEQQVLQSNPILEAFGNARTIRNDNSSRFGKYINIAFTDRGQLVRASIDTYLLEKVRLIHQANGERNFHVFYQFLEAATEEERDDLFLNQMSVEDFHLTNQSDTYDRRDNVDDVDMHKEMVDAMQIMNFGPETANQLMRLVVAVLFAGNMTFTKKKNKLANDTCELDETEASLAVAHLLGVSFDNLAASLTSKVIFARGDIIHKGLDVGQAEKANEALIKSIYGAAFDFIAEKINDSISGGGKKKELKRTPSGNHSFLRKRSSGSAKVTQAPPGTTSIVPVGGASIGVLDIFGFETFQVNNFEQLCINYTNETLQQQFNKFVFKLEQQEYEREGILWKFIPFPDNQDVLDLIDKPRTGILQLLDEQCIVDWGSDKKFSQSLYTNCGVSERFSVSPAQRVVNKFSVDHYAGFVEYTTENWLEKNKDQLPAASVELLESSDFELIGQIKKYVRSEGAKIASKSLGRQFSDSLKVLRTRIDSTMPHYIRCLKPNDELCPDNFDPKNIVEQLRYCGVLEAVRVSRAGYPTRYPHEVFVTRYYMLCPDRSTDEDNLSPYHEESTGNLTEDQKQLKRLVSRVATEIWKIEHDLHQRRLQMERSRVSKVQQQPDDDGNRHSLSRPETLDQFFKLDFSSRCAVAGLQLGKTKVFLRREAFDCIESIRIKKFGPSATKIANAWRRYEARHGFLIARDSAIKIQCLVRMAQAKVKTAELLKEFKQYLIMKEASRKIARCYRNHYALKKEGELLQKKKNAALKIQGCARGRLARKRVFMIVHSIARFQSACRTVKVRRAYQEKRAAAIKIQSLARILTASHLKDEALRERSAIRIQSFIRMKFDYIEFRRSVDSVNLIKRVYRKHLYQIHLLNGTFLKRYYMLGDPSDFVSNQSKSKKQDKKKKVILARHRNAIINERRLELTKLVNKLTLEIWEPGVYESFEKPVASKKKSAMASVPAHVVSPSRKKVAPKESPRAAPQASPQAAPETPSSDKKKKSKLSLFSMKRKSSKPGKDAKNSVTGPISPTHPTTQPSTPTRSKPTEKVPTPSRPPPAPFTDFTPIPRTKTEFLERSVSSQYCLVGLQMYCGEVLLRPETFARLEKMRNDKVAGSAAKIQAAARRKLAINDLKRKKEATILIQSAIRMRSARKRLGPMRANHCATLIQSIWRMSMTKRSVWIKYWSTQAIDLFEFIKDNDWYMVEKMLHKNPLLVEEEDPETGELALHRIAEHASAWTLLIDMILTLYPKAVVHKDSSGSLPIHHAAKADNITALEIIYESYKNGAKDVDALGRLPIHVAAEYGSIEATKYLVMKVPEGASSVVQPGSDSGGSLPLHVACKQYSSVGVISALFRTTLRFSLASRTDENGELPLHLLLRCGAKVDVVAVKTMLTCHLNAIATRDKAGDIPLHIALKNGCKPSVIDTLLSHFPGSSVVMDGEGHSPLFLALYHSAEDSTSLSLIKHAPELVTLVDDSTGKRPIQVATENDLSLFIVYRLLKRDMPIELNEKVQVRLVPHCYSWNHILLDVEDRYYQVVSKILQQCTQPQVLALAHVEDEEGKIALASATPICRHEIRVMLRLFNTLELVKQRPAFTNAASDTEIFYALRYEPPPEQSDLFSTYYESKKADDEDFVEDWDDDLSQMSNSSQAGAKRRDQEESNLSVAEKLKVIRNEKGQHVIAKITPRSDIVERELKIRKDFNLSRHYVPSVISVHHTVHHGAYANASAEPAYCITMEGADATIEHQMLDLRRAGKGFPANELKRVGISLLHLHENGLVHTDFGPHSVGKFGPLWKLLGVGGCVRVGDPTDPKHGIYHPPEAISVENITVDGKERKTAKVISITASPSHDIWAFGHMVYEAVVGAPLSAYSHRGHRVKSSNLAKVGRWDEQSLKRALKHVDAEDTLARDVISKFFDPDPTKRFQSIRDAIADPFFNTDSGDRKIKRVKKEAS